MMLDSIFLKNLRDRRVALIWWSLSIFLLVLAVVSIYPSIQESAAELTGYIESLPDGFKAAFSVGEAVDIASPTGYLNAELFTFMVPLMFIIFCIGFGSGAIAGEEEAGTLDFLLANPISRTRVLMEKWLAMVAGTTILGLAIWLSAVFSVAVFDLKIGIGQLAATTASSALLGFTMGAVALAVGSATGRKSLGVAIAIGVATASYLLNILSKIVESLEPYGKVSFFYHHLEADPLTNGLQLTNTAVFVGTIVVLLAVALITFNRRDLAV